MNPILQRLWTAAEQSGVALLSTHRDDITGALDGIADEYVDRIVTAIADNLPAGGVKNVEWGPIKGALLASLPQIDEATNEQIGNAFDRTVAVLKAAA